MDERLEAIHRVACEAASAYRKAEAVLIEALIAVERERVFAKLGFSSMFLYAVQALKLSEAAAYAAIAVARKATQVPGLRSAIQEGAVSMSKATKVLSVLTEQNQEVWIEKLKTLPTRVIEKEVAKENPKVANPERARYVSDQRLALALGVSEELMFKLKRVQDRVSQSKSRAVSLEEAFEAMADFYLKHNDPVENAKRVIAKKGVKESKSSSREELKPHQRRPIPAAIAHQVRLRDEGKCQHNNMYDPRGSICGQKRWVDLHHLIPVSQGGQNTVENLVTLCRVHHQLRHEAG